MKAQTNDSICEAVDNFFKNIEHILNSNIFCAIIKDKGGIYMASKENVQDLILRGFKLSSICEKLNIEMKEAKEFSIHPSRQEIAAYQIAYIREHYTEEQILDAFMKLKRTEDLQTKINRLEYFTLGCAFGLHKTVFETLLGREQFGALSRQFRKEKTERTVMERYGVTSVSLSPEVLKKREQTKLERMQNPKTKKEPNISVSDEIVEQVRDLTLRGFNRRYIRSKLNLSQPAMKLIGFYPSRDEIVGYQVQYIKDHYTIPEIEKALNEIHQTEDFQAKANRHELHSLGCSFGSITQPFSKLLGMEVYKRIVYKNATEKMIASGVMEESRRKRRETMLERYGVEEPNQNKEIRDRMVATLRNTNMERYGAESAMKCPEIAAKATEKRQQTMMALYGAPNSVQIPEIREKIQESRRKKTEHF